jgi:hypothetical protein
VSGGLRRLLAYGLGASVIIEKGACRRWKAANGEETTLAIKGCML